VSTKRHDRPAWFVPVGIVLVVISLALFIIGVLNWVQIGFEHGFYNVLIGLIGVVMGALIALRRL
jgi:hypothetical protein